MSIINLEAFRNIMGEVGMVGCVLIVAVLAVKHFATRGGE